MCDDLLGTGDAESSGSTTAIFVITEKSSLQSLNHACYMNNSTRHTVENPKGNSSFARHSANVKPRKPDENVSSETSVDVSS